METQKFKLSKKESLIVHYKNLEQLLEAIIEENGVYIRALLNDYYFSNNKEFDTYVKISEIARKKLTSIALAEAICESIFNIYNQSPRVFQLISNAGLKDSVAYRILSIWFNRRTAIKELIHHKIFLGLIDYTCKSNLLSEILIFRV